MAKISINTNIAEVTGRIRDRLNKLKDKEYVLRPVCFDLIDLMKLRIHDQGKKSDGSAIGTYSNAYLKFRQTKHQRSADRKVIISLTRQLENDWSVIATQNGYGIGFKNPFNLEKARWAESGHDPSSVKAHKRIVKTKDGTKTINVSGHQRKGWKGYGAIFSLTKDENKYASDLINELVNEALSSD